MSTTFEQTYTAEELRDLAIQRTGRKIGRTQFYSWLDYCLIKRGKPYTARDLNKLIFFGRALNHFKKIDYAQQALIKGIREGLI